MTSPSLRALANQIASLRRQVHAQATASQASLRSIEGGSIDVYDDDENLIGVIGLQRDGSVGAVVKGGPKPETPTDPDVNQIPGGAIVAWDGQFEEPQSMTAIDRIAVHYSDEPGFVHDEDTEVAAIYSPNGGTAVIPLDAGATGYLKLVAVAKGGSESDPTTELVIDPLEVAVAFRQDEFVLSTTGAQGLQLRYEPLADSEHLYWHPGGGAGLYQREDISWTRDGKVVSLLDAGRLPQAGDAVTVEYAYVDPDPGYLYAANVDNPIVLPSVAQAGDVAVVAVMFAVGGGFTLNGWTLLHQSDLLAHTVNHGQSIGTSYRLLVMSRVLPADGSLPTPTFSPNSTNRDTPYVVAIFPGSTTIAASAINTVPNGTSATAPAATGGAKTMRVWATMGDNPFIQVPDGLDVVAENNPPRDPTAANDIQIVLTVDDGDGGGAQTATCAVSVGWAATAIAIN